MSSQHALSNHYVNELTLEQGAALARVLIVANEHYRLSNSDEVAVSERLQHRLQARIQAEEVLSQHPVNAAALNLLGRISLDDGLMKEAIALLQDATALAPDNCGYWTNLGYVYLSGREFEKAEAAFTQALSLQGNAAQAYAGVAYALLGQGDYLGAFMRLKSLQQKGYDNLYCRRALFDAIQHLWADRYDPELEQSLLGFYEWADQDAFQLGNLSASLLIHKYQLNCDDATLDFDQLVADPLILAALHRSLLPNHLVEALLTGLRQSILQEAFSLRSLREDLQPMVCALAEYSARTGYAFSISEDEQHILNQLHRELMNSLSRRNWQQEEVIGALMLTSLYEPLYRQPYSYQLLRDDLQQWPDAFQPIVQIALYEPADQHMTEYEILGTTSPEELAATPLVRGASPLWETLGRHPQTNYRAALGKALGDATLIESLSADHQQILVTGCRSGQRALSLARFFSDVEVTACDANLDNVVFAVRSAHRFGLNNLSFHCADLAELDFNGQQFDVIECGPALGPLDKLSESIGKVASLLRPGGIIRFTFPRRNGRRELEEARQRMQDHRIIATPENVRAVRQIMMSEATQGLWQDIIAQPDFYTLAGTRDLLFAANEPSFNLEEVQALLKSAQLQFLGFVDLDPGSRQRVRALNQRDLMAWHNLDESQQTVFHDTYEIYCSRV